MRPVRSSVRAGGICEMLEQEQVREVGVPLGASVREQPFTFPVQL